MRAVKIADTDVKYAGGKVRPAVSRCLDGFRKTGEHSFI
jgi:hypothetical protein